MKLAWLVWQDVEDTRPDIVFEEPGDYYYYKVVPIVYAEILHE